MATNFAFDPVDGLRNKTSFPTYPANEDEARLQFQTPLNQLRDFINSNLVVNMGTWFDFKANGGNIGNNISIGAYTDTTTKYLETRRAVNGKEVLCRVGLMSNTEIGASTLQFVEKSTGALLGDVQLSNEYFRTSKNLDLGSSDSKWQDGYFSGKINIGSDGWISDNGGYVEFTGTNNNGVYLTSKDKASVGISGDGTSFSPLIDSDGKVDLGSTSAKWKNVWVGDYSKNSNGYAELTNGMIMQWGIDTSGATSMAITFPIAFPTACIFTTTEIITDVASGKITTSAFVSRTGFTIKSVSGQTHLYWFAIGY